jgi:zinc protease
VTRIPTYAAAAAAGVLLAAAAVGLPVRASSARQGAATTKPAGIPAVKFRDRTLPNGLRVLSSENHRAPTVAVYVVYHVGSKDDPPGRSGFAHLFEHMMFKSTAHMKSETLDRLTEDVGGENNAYTADDVTVYHETVPSNHLDRLLWAEADRMANLKVDQANFASERAVVQEEFRQSVLAPPYGRLGLAVAKYSYTAHPYRLTTIGSIEDLAAATLEDVQRFHRTFYRPDNATLVVVGDFDPARLDALVDKYFGAIPKPAGDVPRVTVKEPARTQEKRYAETAPNVPLPAVVITYLTPGVADEDAAALQVADTILSGGESSRLYRSLVYEQQVAQEASSSADLREDNGLVAVQVTAAGGKPIAAGEKAALAVVEKLRTTPVGAAELAKAKNLLLTSELRGRETADGTANALGYAAVVEGDPNRINSDLARLQAVTAADVQRVAQKYFAPENRVVIRYSSAAVQAAGKGAAK